MPSVINNEMATHDDESSLSFSTESSIDYGGGSNTPSDASEFGGNKGQYSSVTPTRQSYPNGIMTSANTPKTNMLRRSVTFVEPDPPAREHSRITYTMVNNTPPSTPKGDTFDAQYLYPPSACVFVANLPEAREDDDLHAAVTKEFSCFGVVYVKIRRDPSNMPFAFCQYTDEDHAKDAVINGKGIMILGRPCRTEMVKANRTYAINRRDYGDITVHQAMRVLEAYGELSKCYLLPTERQKALGLPATVIAAFTTFDPARDMGTVAKQNPEYRIVPYDEQKGSITPPRDPNKEFLKQYEIDRQTLYVAHLPRDIDEAELGELFSQAGTVRKCTIVRKDGHSYYGARQQFYAFVEYENIGEPDEAIRRFRGYELRGHPLKVERKATKSARRMVSSPASSDTFKGGPRTPNTPSRSTFAHRSVMQRSSVPEMAASVPQPTSMLLAYPSEGSPPQRGNVHTTHGFHRANGIALDDSAIQNVSAEPLAVKPIKSMPNFGAHGAQGDATSANNLPAGILLGPSASVVPRPQFTALPHPTADVNGRPIHPMEPLPITSWDQPQPGYPHVGYIPDWDMHSYMTGMPGTGPILPPNVQQAPHDLVMHNWTPEFAPPIPLECVPRGFVRSHFAYHPITGQHCAVWIPGAAPHPSVY
ncbi:unnamed protein product [Sordaria macrospora k-hell]|uniref:WGS project CABT00000000 data, contig 2.6 n=1 Tax=Sordaria macrospora (strain ATCC MYA-333 / DSM 997 / K(L3346) / K-hell) TaxID=771870 RepID=F7VSW3_SORMK|nr:uncharacterized protein SMAC_05420 [Sordaria macrospora k-hell]CCC08780.1 unnamed protein product [Sordaria macrospora k-hell]